MNDNFRVRLKPQVKLKIGVLVLLSISVLGAFLWMFVTSDLFEKKDTFKHTNFVALEAESCRYYGKYPKWKCKFKVKYGAYFISELTAKPNQDGKYCIGHIFKNGDFIDYVMAHHDQCV